MALSKRKQPEPTPGRRKAADRPAERSRPQAFSYHASRSQRDVSSTRTAPVTERSKEPSSLKVTHILYIAAGILVIVAALFQTTTPKVQVVGTEASRQLLQAPLVYEEAAAKLLSGSQANHFKLLTDDTSFEAGMEQQFPELAAVQIEPALVGTRPTVIVEAVQPAFVFNGNGGSFVVDANGTVRLAASQLTDTVKAGLPSVIDQSGLTLTPGKPALPASDTAFILQILAQLKAAGIGWEQITLPVNASEVDIKIADQNYFVKFALRGGADARQQAGTFLAVKDKVGNATYIDVRVPERAYFR